MGILINDLENMIMGVECDIGGVLYVFLVFE